jgi:putative ABC transport system ATP-binding protein
LTQTQKAENIIEIQNVIKEYIIDEAKFRALNGINLTITKGEFAAIVGPSGSGKSTLLHILGCLDNPSSGEIKINGISVSKFNRDQLAEIRNKYIGFVFQAFNLSPNLDVFTNVELPLIIKGVDKKQRKSTVEKYLKVVGLAHKSKSMTSQLSGGEKQRIAIARALVNEPQIILADEPTGNLDSKSGKDIMDFISNLWKEKGITVIIVTHEPVVASYSQKVIHLRDGKIEKETKNNPNSQKSYSNLKIK